MLGCKMTRSCSLSPTTSAISVSDSSDTTPMSMMGVHDHGDSMEWSENYEKYFLEILSEKVKKDPNGQPIFKGTDWIELDEKIFLKFTLRYGPDRLKGKYQRLKSTCTKFCELISTTGVTWDHSSGQVFANDEMWTCFEKRDKVFKVFRKKGCKLYSLMSLVFNKSNASGSFHNASSYGPQNSEEERRIESEYLGGNEDGDCAESDGKKRKLEGDMENPGMRRMKTSSGKYDALVDVWSKSLMAKAERDMAKAEKYKSTEVKDSVTDEFSIDECMKVLEATPNVTTRSYNKALKHFHKHKWRKIFLLMSEVRRKAWLDELQE